MFRFLTRNHGENTGILKDNCISLRGGPDIVHAGLLSLLAGTVNGAVFSTSTTENLCHERYLSNTIAIL